MWLDREVLSLQLCQLGHWEAEECWRLLAEALAWFTVPELSSKHLG